jgi:hypothetical protein
MHENPANKKLLYEKELDEEAIKIAAAKEASYQQALDNEAISSASAICYSKGVKSPKASLHLALTL